MNADYSKYRSLLLMLIVGWASVVAAQQNYGFVSPNKKTDLKLADAIAGMNSAEESKLLNEAINLSCVVRSRIRASRALGAWSEGAEHSVMVRYVAQVSRNSAPGQVFAQMVTGLALANDPQSRVVATNLVQGEDGVNSMQNFSLHMQMLKFLRPLYPRAHVTLHAGELAPGLVPPDGLTFHIRESVMIARAERIGHGVDIMHEIGAFELLKEMARRNVMVEICLSSNDLILGISGSHHPLATYLEYNVPVALATDDEGVARSEISMEFLKAAEEQGLGYIQLKTFARNSLQYAFIPGESLWSDGRKFVPVAQCARDVEDMKLTSNSCRQFLTANEKSKLQWQLEQDFRAFEHEW
jgi:hypothetical protein